MSSETEKQKTGAKILNMLQNLHDKIDIFSNRMENDVVRVQSQLDALENRLNLLEERMDNVKGYVQDLGVDLHNVDREVEKILEQMPDLQTVVQDMERRERAYMHQTPAF